MKYDNRIVQIKEMIKYDRITVDTDYVLKNYNDEVLFDEVSKRQGYLERLENSMFILKRLGILKNEDVIYPLSRHGSIVVKREFSKVLYKDIESAYKSIFNKMDKIRKLEGCK